MRAYLWLSETDGSRRRLVTNWLQFRASRQQNAVGRLDLYVSLDAPASLTRRNARLEVWTDSGLLAGGVYFVRAVEDAALDDVACLRVLANDQIDILNGRIVAAAAGTAGAVKTGPADTLIYEYVSEAFSGARADSLVTVALAAGTAPSSYKVAPRRQLLGVCQDVARSSAELGTGLFFDFVPLSDGRLEFRQAIGQMGVNHLRTGLGPVSLSATAGTLTDAKRGDDWRGEINVVYAAGQGLASQRLVAEVSDAERATGPLARRERFIDARHLSSLPALQAQAGAVLSSGRPTRSITGVAGAGFGVRWGYGDLVEADDGAGGVVSCRVAATDAAAAGPDADLVISVELIDLAGESSVSLTIEQQLEETATQESGSISQTPLAYGIPQAGAGGTIADGWFSATWARLVDLTWVNITGKPSTFTPAAHVHDGADVTTGTVAESRISGLIARLVDLTWANITGKPASFTPSAHKSTHATGGADVLSIADIGAAAASHAHAIADLPVAPSGTSSASQVVRADDTRLSNARTPSTHAASHQHGGADEVSTATAAANAIPKAGAGGTLADGWMSANMARLATAQTWTANQRIDALLGIGVTADRSLLIDTSGNSLAFGEASMVMQGEGNKERFEIRSWGASDPVFQAKRAAGTKAVPTATAADTYLFALGGSGHDGSAFVLGNKALIAYKTAELWTTTAQGTYILFETTKKGTTARVERGRFTDDGAFELLEIAAPATPVADRARLYLEDNGAGKTRLVVKWSTGTTTILATQP